MIVNQSINFIKLKSVRDLAQYVQYVHMNSLRPLMRHGAFVYLSKKSRICHVWSLP